MYELQRSTHLEITTGVVLFYYDAHRLSYIYKEIIREIRLFIRETKKLQAHNSKVKR